MAVTSHGPSSDNLYLHLGIWLSVRLRQIFCTTEHLAEHEDPSLPL